jgi:hypothetical protein
MRLAGTLVRRSWCVRHHVGSVDARLFSFWLLRHLTVSRTGPLDSGRARRTPTSGSCRCSATYLISVIVIRFSDVIVAGWQTRLCSRSLVVQVFRASIARPCEVSLHRVAFLSVMGHAMAQATRHCCLSKRCLHSYVQCKADLASEFTAVPLACQWPCLRNQQIEHVKIPRVQIMDRPPNGDDSHGSHNKDFAAGASAAVSGSSTADHIVDAFHMEGGAAAVILVLMALGILSGVLD